MSSYYPEDGHGNGHSRSRSHDDRRSKDTHAPDPMQYADVREPSFIYPEDDLDDRYRGRPEAQASGALPYPEEGGSHFPGDQKLYGYESQRPVYKTASPPADSPYRSSHGRVDSGGGLLPGAFPDEEPRGKDKDDGPRTRFSDHEDKPGGRRDDKPGGAEGLDSKLKLLPQKLRQYMTEDHPKEPKERKTGKDKYDDDLAYGKPPVPKRPHQPSDDLAYGKGGGLPAAPSTQTSSSQTPTPTAYGAKPPPETQLVKRDEQRDEKYDDRQPYNDREQRYYDGPDERYYDDRYDDERRDERRDDRKARRQEEKRASRYQERDESPDRRYQDYRYDDPRRYQERDDREPYVLDDRGSHRPSSSLREDANRTSANVLTVEPGSHDRERSRDRRRERSGSDLLTVDDGRHKRDKSKTRDKSKDKSKDKSRDKSRERSRDRRRDKSPAPDKLSVGASSRRERSRSRDTRGTMLSVATGSMAGLSLASAPASPLLESYRGTYQDCSPMPSPLLVASTHPDDLRGLEPLSPSSSDLDSDGRKRGRRARFHDAEDITTQIANALKGHKHPETAPLIEILPGLTHEQVMELRAEYKRIVKTGSERKGVNVAKHIRARLKDEDPVLMKACYAVALGMWESEAYWANFWYQGDKTRRELLIESLMGRPNDEVRAIKDAFSDKKYDNSLIKCMKTELKEDKFKKAVLMVLDECRMEEYDGYGRLIPINYDLVDHDVSELRRAVKSDKGGETAMIGIVIQRSDSHLRAVLKEYEHSYGTNFARDALKKSGNLVGELLAHILNGVINRPVRDALLLHHAITASRKDGLRRELLISRLVRYHWDPQHMRAIKHAYRERYGKGLSEAVQEVTSGEWGDFCRELCIARTPDEVRRFDKISVTGY